MKLIVDIPDSTYYLIRDVATVKHTTIDVIVNDIINLFVTNLSADKAEKNGQIDKQTLWNKAGTSNHITRADVNIRPPKDNSGIQALNEGYL